ncbi:MAG: DUF927 domain-containing protein [Candidatus Scatosoma sp.]
MALIAAGNNTYFNYLNKNLSYNDDCPYFEATGFVRNVNANVTEMPKLKIEYNDRGLIGTVYIDRQFLSNVSGLPQELCRQGLYVKHYHGHDATQLLTKQARILSRNPLNTELHHTKLGWHTIDGEECFLYDDSTKIGQQTSVCDREFSFQAGNYVTYSEMLKNLVYPSKELTLAYVLGFSAVVVSRLNRNRVVELGTIVINVNGKSSTGKSTMEQLLISPFGNPVFSKHGLGITHAGTLNGIMDALEGVHGLPRVIDDLQQNSSINLTELLYTISQEETKMRCGEQWNQNTDGWSGLVVVSSETPLMGMMKVQQGTYPRLLNITSLQWTKTAEEAEKIKATTLRNYGFTGKKFIEYIKNMPIEQLADKYFECVQRVKPMMEEKDGLSDRIASRIAAIGLTCELVKDCFQSPFEWEMEELIKPIIDSEQETVQERNPAEQLLDILTTYVQAQNNIHFDLIKHYPPKDGVSSAPLVANAKQVKEGKIEISTDGCWTIGIYKKRMDKLLKEYEFNEWGSASAELKRRGILQTTKEKKKNGTITERTRVRMDGVWCYVFKIKMQPNEIVPTVENEAKPQEQPLQETPVDDTEWNAGESIDDIFGGGVANA